MWRSKTKFDGLHPLHCLVGNSDCLNFEPRIGGVKGRDLDDRVSRIWKREVATPQLDDLRKVRHVPEEDCDLDDVIEARAAGTENPSEVGEDLLGLGIEVADTDELSVPVDRRLARDEEKSLNGRLWKKTKSE